MAPSENVPLDTFIHSVTKSDVNSNNGMQPNIWGPLCWSFLHTVSFNYPLVPTCDQKKNHRNFIESLGNILPCRECREHFHENLKMIHYGEHVYTNRASFSKFLFDLHNIVNKRLGKKLEKSFKTVRKRHELFRSRCSYNSTKKRSDCQETLQARKCKSIISIVPRCSTRRSLSINTNCFPKTTIKKPVTKLKTT